MLIYRCMREIYNTYNAKICRPQRNALKKLLLIKKHIYSRHVHFSRKRHGVFPRCVVFLAVFCNRLRIRGRTPDFPPFFLVIFLRFDILVFGQHRGGPTQRYRGRQRGDLQIEIQSTAEEERRYENPEGRAHHKHRWCGDTGTKNENYAQGQCHSSA